MCISMDSYKEVNWAWENMFDDVEPYNENIE
jgi:hypothetical protein